MTPGEQAAQVGGARVRPGMVGPPGHQVRGFRAPASLDEGGAPGQDRAFILRAPGGEEGYADGIGRFFVLHGHR
jgi:hypothetical protein